MTAAELLELRTQWGLTQAELAERLGMTLRVFGSIERGAAKLRPAYELALDQVSMKLAVERGNLSHATAAARDTAKQMSQLLTIGG